MSEEETTAAASEEALQEPAEDEDAAEAADPKKPKRSRKPKRPAGRSFQLKADGPHRVCFGSSPRVAIAAGETYTTEDARLARRLAAHEHLEETT